MSRAYRIRVQESLRRHVQVEDGVQSSLELLPILEKERMRELLASELAARGFTREGDLAKRTQAGGIVVEVNLSSGEVTVTAEAQAHLELNETRTANVERAQVDQGTARLQEQAQDHLAARADAAQETLRQEVTKQLEAALEDLKGELNQVTNRVTAEALKKRAAELGTVEEVHEEANGNLTIKVRV